MIYTFNLMVELEPNGVDVAQAYRGQIFRKLGCPARFVFTQVPPRYKWDYYLSLGYAEDEIILAHRSRVNISRREWDFTCLSSKYS